MHALEYRFGSRQPLGFTVKSEAHIASVTGPVSVGEPSPQDIAPHVFEALWPLYNKALGLDKLAAGPFTVNLTCRSGCGCGCSGQSTWL